jgi:hypothetical protein
VVVRLALPIHTPRRPPEYGGRAPDEGRQDLTAQGHPGLPWATLGDPRPPKDAGRARAKEERDRHGNVSIVYTENVSQENPDGTKADEFARPVMFLVRVPVYQDGTEYTLPVRVETKVAGGKVQWTYRFHRPDKAALDAQNDIAKAFAERTGLAVFRGSME